MDEILQQVGTLLLGAIPTALLFIVLVLAYQFLIQGPLSRTLKERRARTQGAVEEAHKAIARAEERAQEYANKLRQARTEVYKAREQRIKQWSAERDAALARVSVVIKADWRSGVTDAMTSKTESVERHLSAHRDPPA